MKILFSGCSIVRGDGLPSLDNDPGNFANIIGKSLGGRVTNIAQGGNSNERIFVETAAEMAKTPFDLVFVCWTSYPRHVFWPGLELYECRRCFTPNNTIIVEHNGNSLSWTTDQFEKIKKWFLLLTHDHYYILDICRYVRVLKKLAEAQGSKIYFVNSLAPWDSGYFEQFDQWSETTVKSNMLTNYTNQLLNSENRDDEQINALFHQMRKDYQSQGGISPDDWLNLYESLAFLQIDYGNDNEHPGPSSHKKFAEFLLKSFVLKNTKT